MISSRAVIAPTTDIGNAGNINSIIFRLVILTVFFEYIKNQPNIWLKCRLKQIESSIFTINVPCLHRI